MDTSKNPGERHEASGRMYVRRLKRHARRRGMSDVTMNVVSVLIANIVVCGIFSICANSWAYEYPKEVEPEIVAQAIVIDDETSCTEASTQTAETSSEMVVLDTEKEESDQTVTLIRNAATVLPTIDVRSNVYRSRDAAQVEEITAKLPQLVAENLAKTPLNEQLTSSTENKVVPKKQPEPEKESKKQTESEKSDLEYTQEYWPDEYIYKKGEVLNSHYGVVIGPNGKETFYNRKMSGVISIMENAGYSYEYWVRDDGVKMYGDYVIVAADQEIRPLGTILMTTLGMGIVCDTGTFIYHDRYQIDIATNWRV